MLVLLVAPFLIFGIDYLVDDVIVGPSVPSSDSSTPSSEVVSRCRVLSDKVCSSPGSCVSVSRSHFGSTRTRSVSVVKGFARPGRCRTASCEELGRSDPSPGTPSSSQASLDGIARFFCLPGCSVSSVGVDGSASVLEALLVPSAGAGGVGAGQVSIDVASGDCSEHGVFRLGGYDDFGAGVVVVTQV